MFVCISIPPMRARYQPIQLSSYDHKNYVRFEVLSLVTPNASSGVWSRVFWYICTDVWAAVTIASQKITQANIPGVTIFESQGGLFHLYRYSNNNLHTNAGVIFQKELRLLDFKLSPCTECCTLSVGWFPGVWNLYADVSEHSVCSIFIGRHLPAYENGTECPETSAYTFQTPGNHPKESIELRLPSTPLISRNSWLRAHKIHLPAFCRFPLNYT